jgi:hypothetical protein
MKTTARLFLLILGLGLAAFTVVSFFVLGGTATATVTGFALLVVYGVAEMMIIEYRPRPQRMRLPVVAKIAARGQVRATSHRSARFPRPAIALARAA